ncbi:DsbA family protein [uncultured Gulosibacter sp.]|uniref:DsbA family protein n=1 Tax=uncultured Gulosibacter sp. TaxID=1339167 RepID=UPI00288C5757|nr:DsbA family protein [uncultured Gulosibacter sp.]
MKFSNREKWLVGAIVAVALIAVFAIFARPAGPGSEVAQERAINNQQPTVAQTAPQDQATGQDPADQQVQQSDLSAGLARRDADDYTAIGDVDAPLVMIEYSDYRCPYCALYATETQPELIKKYVDTGKLRIEWRDTPIFGEQSLDAAVAARAAGEQGMFLEYNRAIFNESTGSGHTELPRERLVEIAKEVGIPNLEKFAADLDSPQLLQLVQADYEEAVMIGVNSTPTFLLNSGALRGAYPLETFEQVIDEELARLGVE